MHLKSAGESTLFFLRTEWRLAIGTAVIGIVMLDGDMKAAADADDSCNRSPTVNAAAAIAACSEAIRGRAAALLRKESDPEDAEAQFDLGLLYQEGARVPQDNAEAARLYRLAAYQGYAPAQAAFGEMLRNGRGVPQNFAEAVHWFRLAADQGNAWGQMNLGWMYEYGLAVPDDQVEAVRWFQLAANQGLAAAQVKLGWIYENGRGVPRDLEQARLWYRAAARQGDERGTDSLARLSSIAEKPTWDDAPPRAEPKPRPELADAELETNPLVLLFGAILALSLAENTEAAPAADSSTAEGAPACRQEFSITPSRLPCGRLWAPQGSWPKEHWCYTDFTMQINGNQGVTYCTDGVGTWERSSLFDRCNGVEGWCG